MSCIVANCGTRDWKQNVTSESMIYAGFLSSFTFFVCFFVCLCVGFVFFFS